MVAFASEVASRLNLRIQQVEATLALFEEGATIPFIARYRKDRTGALDEVQVQQVQDTAKFLQEFSERKTFIEKTIVEQGKMTEALQTRLDGATTLAELEDMYLPYKTKRKTRAQIARENGLEPLALRLLEQGPMNVQEVAARFMNDKVATVDDALQGARDIIAEMINEDAAVRGKMRRLFEQKATLQSKVLPDKETEAIKYKDYFDYQEPVGSVPSHRILAVLRGFLEGFLRVTIGPDEEMALTHLEEPYVRSSNPAGEQVKKAVKESYRRLLQPSLESELRSLLKTKGDEDAIAVFAENLRQLLLGSPLGSKRILAIDPGYRTGCKVVCLDERGDFLINDLIYVHEAGRAEASAAKVRQLVARYGIEVFAIGDGTAGRETEQFIKRLELGLPVFLVNEDGASVYSASEIARQEFPEQDITVRGAVSIGRRLMDPLAELVKIDPKSIGVGQYQHDVNQVRLKERLDQTVVSCVNQVGVNLNTASKHLLSYVSGIGPTLAENIVRYRSEVGKFSRRKELLKVPRLGEKAFEQCAGFLRVKESDHPLDKSGVHPEAYGLVEEMARDLRTTVADLIGNEPLIKEIPVKKYVGAAFGEHTIKDILSELKKPGLDPRSEVTLFEFGAVYALEDVQPGMILPGLVTNITRFGAFVDIGVKQDGLVHVSEISHTYIEDPASVLKLNQQVQVKVLEVDKVRKRIALSIKQADPGGRRPASGGGKPRDARPAIPARLAPGAEKPRAEKLAAEKPPANMDDALAQLKKKFGK